MSARAPRRARAGAAALAAVLAVAISAGAAGQAPSQQQPPPPQQQEAPPQPAPGPAPAPKFMPPSGPPPGTPPAVHPHLLPELTAGVRFPRLTPLQLTASGYPDHLHWAGWPGQEPRVDAAGQPYGPLSMCRHRVPRPREGLEIARGEIRFGPLDLTFDPGYEACDMLPYLEWAELGLRRAHDLLGLQTPGDTLRIYNPDNRDEYTSLSGQGLHRTYRLAGDSLIVQPIPILTARTLLGHTAVEATARWLVQEAGGDRLPPWLAHGVPLYLADMGPHLNNFMDQFRVFGPVLLPIARADSVLAAPPAADQELDRQMQRRAQYTAFLMVWRLVEEEGGTEPLARLLAAVATGEEPEAAARKAYGKGLADLAKRLDPNDRGEPVTWDDFFLQPHREPES